MLIFFLFIFLSSSVASTNFDKKVVKLISDFMKLQKNDHVTTCFYSGCSVNGNLDILEMNSQLFKCSLIVQNMERNASYWPFEHHQLFVLDMSCSSSKNFLNKASEMGVLRYQSIWLLIDFLKEDLVNYLSSFHYNTNIVKKLNLSIASEVYLMQETRPNKFKLTEIYSLEPDKSIITKDLLDWNLSTDLTNKILLSTSWRRQDLLGHLFKAAIVVTDENSLKHADDLVGIHIDSLSKVNYVMVSLVALGLNASVDFSITPSWGSKINGTYDGMIGLVVQGKAEIAVTQSFPTEERMEVLDYIDKAVRTRVGFLLMSPPLSFSNNIYILPFNLKVWYCFFGVLLITTLMLYYASKIENDTKGKFYAKKWIRIYRKEKSVGYHRKSSKYSCAEVALLGVASVCQQGSHIRDPNGIVGRMVILTLHVTLILIYVSYSAYIVVLLQSSDKSISSLKDLLQSNLDLGVHDISYNRYYFKAATDPIRRAIYKKITPEKKPDHFVTIEEGIQKVKSGLYAFQVERSPGYQMVKRMFTKDEKCGLQELKESFTPDIEPMLAIGKRLPYSEVLKLMFKRLHERGIAHRIGTRLYTKKPTCSQHQMSYVSIGLMNIRHAFLFLLCAMIVSWIVLIFEILVYRRKLCKCRHRKWV